MACDCVTEINAAINTIENSIQSHTDIKADQVRDATWSHMDAQFTATDNGINSLIAWDNDYGTKIDYIRSEVDILFSQANSHYTNLTNQAQSNFDIVNESVEVAEDNTQYIRDTQIPAAITSIENSIQSHTDIKSDQIRDNINANVDNQATHVIDTLNTSLTAQITALSAQVAALSALVTSSLGADVTRNWTVNP